jgi:hypothetical protein
MPFFDTRYVDARGSNIIQIHGAQYHYIHNPKNGETGYSSVNEVIVLISSQQPSRPSDVQVSRMPSTILAIVPALHVIPIPALIFSTRSHLRVGELHQRSLDMLALWHCRIRQVCNCTKHLRTHREEWVGG